MNTFLILLIAGSISPFIDKIDAAKIYGPGVHFNETLFKIMLKGMGYLRPNKLPDLTYDDNTLQRFPGAQAAVGRRALKEILADDRQNLYREDESIISDGKISANGYLRSYSGLDSVEEFENTFLEPDDSNSRRQTVAKLKVENKWKERHLKRISEIKDFLESSYLATDYLFEEVMRIQRSHVILDPLRQMVEYLHRPYMDTLVNSVFNCFKQKRLQVRPIKNVWKHRIPNNLMIHPLRDPYLPGYY